MIIVLMTALGVGGATLLGTAIGFIFKGVSHKFSDIVLAFASGVMLSAAILGLIVPSVEYGGKYGIIVTVVGIFVGVVCLNLMDRGNERLNKVLLFVFAIAIHNLPEGIAAGVGFGSENTAEAFMIAGGIALQNIPEGMVIIGPMLAMGLSKKRTFLYASLMGVVEVIGTLIGYFAVSISTAILPFALAFAGGTMLYVISDEMIPETHAHGSERGATYALLIGFCVMLVADILLG